ncbi:unnamed protein product (macronuclear) [Paramecium tetraurelia]|uniref:Uncharacterized protein n=1 Tax=Paramecium tetraurelia TaxID=5888 RepID=A0CIE8_PARTE|nr:uncharacterized protein GSPATT00007700001 [Paramecium tetraurelia]CAK70565.1 unnamed protein product [Paramecium tetraurelia]|eukprot:XP_001437962.1 hypothetical protein (macronuclear) [Paramecium tetraurelia strain d4-2]
MAEFQMPLSSIPNSKIYINESTMKKILLQNKGTTMNHTKGFSSMFTNVVCDLSNLETSTDSSSQKNLAGPNFAPHKKDNFRYHIQKPQANLQATNIQRVHRMPMDKKIIRTTLMPKIKPEEQPVDPGLSLLPANPIREQRSYSYKERPYYIEMQHYRKKSKVKLDPPQEIAGRSFDVKASILCKEEWTETQPFNILTIRQEIEKALQKCSPKKQNQEFLDPELTQQKYNPSYMFIEDDRDRFGKQIYPISMPQPRPGPGQYDTDNTSLNYKVNKIQERNTQKRLVQLWQQQF